MYPELFMNASENLKMAILYIFNSSLSAGQLPLGWRCAGVKFLHKPGKTDYYSPSSYRPISLTSVLCELMERIVLSRLEAYVEGKILLDEEQQGFRRFHCIAYAVLKLVQSICGGFGNKERLQLCVEGRADGEAVKVRYQRTYVGLDFLLPEWQKRYM